MSAAMTRSRRAAGGAPNVSDFMTAGAAGQAPQPAATTTVPVSAFFNAGSGPTAASKPQGGGTIPVSAFFGAAGDSQQPSPSQQQSPGVLRSAAAGLLEPVQDAADFGKALYERATNPAYQPQASNEVPFRRGYSAVNFQTPNGKAPQPLPPVPQAQVPGLTNFLYANQPQTFSEKMAYGAGSMLPFAAAQLVPGAGEAADASALGKLATKVRGFGTMLGAGATSGAAQAVGRTSAKPSAATRAARSAARSAL